MNRNAHSNNTVWGGVLAVILSGDFVGGREKEAILAPLEDVVRHRLQQKRFTKIIAVGRGVGKFADSSSTIGNSIAPTTGN